jgi:hypothetical protein
MTLRILATQPIFERMLKKCAWSGGERILLEVAASLFDGESEVSLWQVGERVDNEHWPLIMETLALFGRLQPHEDGGCRRPEKELYPACPNA